MELKDFEALLHICIIFSFLYSFQSLSKKLSVFFSSPFQGSFASFAELTKKVQAIKDNEALIGEEFNSLKDEIEENYIVISKQMSNFVTTTTKDFDPEYNSIFKTCYLYSGFYALFLLVIASLHNYLISPFVYRALFWSDLTSIAFLLLSFGISFRVKKRVQIPLGLTFFCLTVVFFIALYSAKTQVSFPSQNCSVLFAISLIFLTPALHFLRIAIQPVLIRMRVEKMIKKHKKTFDQYAASVNDIQFAQSILNKYKKHN